MTEPRNVTPAGPPGPPSGPPGGPPSGLPGADQAADSAAEWRGWTWDSRRPGFPLLGVLLVLLGIGLLIQFVFPTVSIGTLILLAIGLAFVAAWLFGRSWVAMVPGFLLLALGIAELLEDVAAFRAAGEDVPGLATSALAVGFLMIFVVARLSGRRWRWPLWGAGIFGVIGIAQLSTFIAIPQFGVVVPILIIVLGVIVLINWQRRGR